MKVVKGSLLLCCALLPGGLASAQQGPAKASPGALTLQAGEYEARLLEKVCYTLRDFKWKGRKLLSAQEGAFNGTVLKTVLAQGKPADWVGTGHGRETVESARLTVDGKDAEVPAPSNLAGQEILFTKRSDLVVFSLDARMRLAPDGLTETHTYTAKRDSPNLALLYVFMHSFDNAMTHWVVQKLDNTLVPGQFAGDGKHPFEGALLWTALYSPEQKTGVVYAPSSSAPEQHHFFWDRKGDNKLYLRLRRSAKDMKAGDQWTFAVKLAAFEAPAEGWQDAAAGVAARLHEAWKAERTPEGTGKDAVVP